MCQKGIGSSKASGEEKGKVVGKKTSTQIPTSIVMKPLVTTSATTTYLNVNVDLSKLQQKKWIRIGEGGSS